MIVNSANLRTLGTSFNALFTGGVGQADTDHLRIATPVPSTTGREEYGWLGKIPSVREWIGDRVVQNLKTHDYAIKNKDWELTIAVDRNDIEDDNIGIYAPLFTEMGQSTGAKACELVFEALKNGFATKCYDGQFFFDTDHPVLDKDGVEQPVANTDGGAGAPWFLLSVDRAVKPIILQTRKPWTFVSKDNLADDNVFNAKEFRYGADARMNVGYGFWQFAWGSKQTLDAAHFETAVVALRSMKGDYGRPIGGGKKLLLVVSAANENAARKLVSSQLINGGESNPWAGAAEVMVSPWLG